MKNSEFKFKEIGTNQQKITSFIEVFRLYFELLTRLYHSAKEFLGKQISNDYLVVLIDGEEKPKHYLLRTFIEENNIEVKGLSIEKLIEKELVDADPSEVLSILQEVKDFRKRHAEKFKNGFTDDNFFAEEYFNSESEKYEVNEEFLLLAKDIYTTLTSNKQENEILQTIQKGCDWLNSIQEAGLIKDNIHVYAAFNYLQRAITKDPKSKKFIPDLKMFKRRFGSNNNVIAAKTVQAKSNQFTD